MAKRTRYTPEFKAAVVLEALCGESSQAELCRRYNLSEQQLSKWKQQAIENFASLFGSKDKASSVDSKACRESSALSVKIAAVHGYISWCFLLEPVQSRRASLQELRRDAIVQADLSPQLSQA